MNAINGLFALVVVLVLAACYSFYAASSLSGEAYRLQLERERIITSINEPALSEQERDRRRQLMFDNSDEYGRVEGAITNDRILGGGLLGLAAIIVLIGILKKRSAGKLAALAAVNS